MSYDTRTVDPDIPPARHSSPRSAFDRVYERLIRDLFARSVPGLLLLFSLAVSISSFDEVGMAIERATAGMWLIGLGGGWLTAFALLELGRRFNLALVTPEAITDEQYWAAEERFRAAATRRQHAEYDRLVTIRDAMAAASVSLFVSLLALGVDFVVDVHLHESPWSEIKNGATAMTLLTGIGIALQLTHRLYVRRAWCYLSYAGNTRG